MKVGVIMLVNEFPPLRVGGAEKQAERLSRYLSLQGWPIWVITRHQRGLAYDELQEGVHVIRPSTVGPGKFKTLSFVLASLWQLWHLRNRYEILHAHLAFGPAFAGVIAARFLGKHSIVKLGNSGEFGDVISSQKSLRGRLRLSVIGRWADLVIVLDEAMKQEAITAGFDAKRLRLMSNGIDALALNASISELERQITMMPADRIIAIFVGRLTRQKSLNTLLQALAIAIRSCPALHLVLLGEGPERSELEQQVSAMAITDHVTFAGYHANVASYLQNAHMFVLPSISEGISNALLEAMSFGLPCLVSSVGGNPEVLGHGEYGILLPPQDVDAWACALVEMAGEGSRRNAMGALARKRIADTYDFGVVGGKYEELYAELLSKGRNN